MKKLILFAVMAFFIMAFASISFACGDGKKSAKSSQSASNEAVTLGDVKEAAADQAPKVFDAKQPVGTQATCPVMGGSFEISEDTPHSEVNGKHVYFCCPGCKPAFDKEPEKFLK